VRSEKERVSNESDISAWWQEGLVERQREIEGMKADEPTAVVIAEQHIRAQPLWRQVQCNNWPST
jgi:hypothetical protein